MWQPKGEVPPAHIVFRVFRPDRCTEPWPAWNLKRRIIKCPECVDRNDGGDIAVFEELAPQKIAGRMIGGLYWSKIASLGEVRFNPEGTPDDPIQFVCGDLEGILMPLCPDSNGPDDGPTATD
jgi:hypothetical protein